MKKYIILTFTILFILCGCNVDNTISQREKVEINLPNDNSVNGYRIESSNENNVPNVISGSDVFVDEDSTTLSNDYTNTAYCGNKNSKKFHKSTCGALKNTKAENKVYLASKQAFLDEGYVECKLCQP